MASDNLLYLIFSELDFKHINNLREKLNVQRYECTPKVPHFHHLTENECLNMKVVQTIIVTSAERK